jgi:predicted PurR-regulated permease PerM
MSGHRPAWKSFLLTAAATVGAAVAAAIAWGFVAPEPAPETPEGVPPGGPIGPGPAYGLPATAPAPTEVTGQVTTRVPAGAESKPPPWVKPTIRWTILLIVAVVVATLLLGVLQQVVLYLVLALFFSFALEPAVNYLHDRRGWRRGSATGLLLALAFVFLAAIVLIFLSVVIEGAQAIVRQLPAWIDNAETWLSDTFGIDVSTEGATQSAEDASASLADMNVHPVQALLGFSMGLLGGIFAAFTVGMFIFYMVAEGPRFKRAVLSFFPSKKQEELVSIWEAAIEKTGGYFYSKLLLAVINGTGGFLVLSILDVPGAAALGLFQGAVAAFIPIIGTYIASAVPIVIALLAQGWEAALIYLIYVLIYQQIENYLISPRLQGKVMQLHPAVAFGAALAGGALGGILWAFLALPFAATVQASASLYIERHEVEQEEFLEHPVARQRQDRPEEAEGATGVGGRVGDWMRRSRGWLRRDHDTGGADERA